MSAEYRFAPSELSGRRIKAGFHCHTIESDGGLTPERMRAYFEQRYSPGNITLAATGNVDFDKLVSHAQQHCGLWELLEVRRHTPPVEVPWRFQKAWKENKRKPH